jgi:hypothetical protein
VEQQLLGNVEAEQIQPEFWSAQSSSCHNAPILTWLLSLHSSGILTEVDGLCLNLLRGKILEDFTQTAPTM